MIVSFSFKNVFHYFYVFRCTFLKKFFILVHVDCHIIYDFALLKAAPE